MVINRLATHTDAAGRGTVPGSLAILPSFYITFASKPTPNLIEGTVPFFRFPLPLLRAVMRPL